MSIKKTGNEKIITEADVLRKHYKFVRDSDSDDNSGSSNNHDLPRQRSREKKKQPKQLIHEQYGERLAKRYEENLFREYAIVDLSRFQTGQIGCRWRTKNEVLIKKGEISCAEVSCLDQSKAVYQMNFGYMEHNKKKNSLVKISVCPNCAIKLNYKKQLRRILEKQEQRNYLVQQQSEKIKIQQKNY